ncbi:hypothetical protein ACCD04_03000 [Telluria sp. Tellsp131]
MQDEAIYRCINTACARGMPRRVQYCPYCGTAQQAGAPPPPQDDGHVRRVAADNVTTAAAATAGAEAVAGLSGWSDAPDTVQEAPPQPSPKPTPPATAFGHGGRPVEAHTAPPPERGRGIPWSPRPTPPPSPAPAGRQPIRLRWWIVALAVLWGVWLWAKPSAKKIDKRIDGAIALAQACQGKQAQAELIALRGSRATPQQLERLQRELNEASSACTRKRQRASAWAETRGPIESSLASGSVERARTRLQAFTKRWGEDDNTRALKARIDAARAEHPLAIPPDAQ